MYLFFFFQAEDGIRDIGVTGVQTCALPILGFGPPCGISASCNVPYGFESFFVNLKNSVERKLNVLHDLQFT